MQGLMPQNFQATAGGTSTATALGVENFWPAEKFSISTLRTHSFKKYYSQTLAQWCFVVVELQAGLHLQPASRPKRGWTSFGDECKSRVTADRLEPAGPVLRCPHNFRVQLVGPAIQEGLGTRVALESTWELQERNYAIWLQDSASAARFSMPGMWLQEKQVAKHMS